MPSYFDPGPSTGSAIAGSLLSGAAAGFGTYMQAGGGYGQQQSTGYSNPASYSTAPGAYDPYTGGTWT